MTNCPEPAGLEFEGPAEGVFVFGDEHAKAFVSLLGHEASL